MSNRAGEEKFYRELLREIMIDNPENVIKVVAPNYEKYKRWSEVNPWACFIIIRYKRKVVSIPIGILMEPFKEGIKMESLFYDEEEDIMDLEDTELLDNFFEEEELQDIDVVNDEEEDDLFDKYSYLDDEEY